MKSSFARFATVFLVYLILVILFGAWVRITGSGAGCGSHWPTCHGEVIPIDPSTETIIEYTHRLTSGFLGILGLVLVGWAWARHRGGRVFKAAVVTLILIVFEALIGAGLVLRELVADDDSVARAVVIAIHLANTLILTAASTLTVYWDKHDAPIDRSAPNAAVAVALCVLSLVLLIVTSMTGAVTALGDTLFPVDIGAAGGLLGRIEADLSATNHFLIRLRIVHPIVAIATAIFIAAVTFYVRARDFGEGPERWASLLFLALIAQVFLGFVNIALAAPGWMQILHLLLAQLTWIVAILLTVSIASAPAAPRGTA